MYFPKGKVLPQHLSGAFSAYDCIKYIFKQSRAQAKPHLKPQQSLMVNELALFIVCGSLGVVVSVTLITDADGHTHRDRHRALNL